MRVVLSRLLCSVLLLAPCLAAAGRAEPVTVRYPQGSAHAFLSLTTLEGTMLATGEVTETVQGSRVTGRLIFRFKDSSVDDDLTVFTQRGTFRLVSDHHIQRGPAFPKPIDEFINAVTGQITTRSPDGKVTDEHVDLAPDLANGLPPNLLLNISPSTPETKLSYVAPGEKARLVHLSVKAAGSLPFTVGGLRRKAIDYTIHVELGGIAGVVAPLIGKEPADYHIWIMQGNPPVCVREEGPLYLGGPVWRIEQVSAQFKR